MFASLFAFVMVLTQLSVVLLSYHQKWPEVFAVSFYQISPIMVFLGLLNELKLFSGIASDWVWVGLVYCLTKYFMLTRALVNDDPNFFSLSALVGEVLLIAGSSWYIVYYFYK